MEKGYVYCIVAACVITTILIISIMGMAGSLTWKYIWHGIFAVTFFNTFWFIFGICIYESEPKNKMDDTDINLIQKSK